MIEFVLTLYFACNPECGNPSFLAVPQAYKTMAECQKAGQEYTKKEANPAGAIDHYKCTQETE